MENDCGCGHTRVLRKDSCLVCHESTPESLLETTIKFIINNLTTTICDNNGPLIGSCKLKSNIILPAEICDQLVSVAQKHNKISNKLLSIFDAPEVTRLRHLILSNADISNLTLKKLLQNHQIVEIDLTNCQHLSHFALEMIYAYGTSLRSLAIREDTSIIIPQDHVKIAKLKHMCQLSQLQKCTMQCVLPVSSVTFNILLSNLVNLTYLDLSESVNLGEMQFLQNFPFLQSLILYNVPKLEVAFPAICQVTTLRHLDISQSQTFLPFDGIYTLENQTLALIMEHLTSLQSLDISGTNLAGTGVAQEGFEEDSDNTDIPGLCSRISTPLHFLGLYGSHHAACRRHDIPALMIAGDATEEQVLIAATAYMERPDVLQRVLNDLYHMFRFETSQYAGNALSLILKAMDRHPMEKQIQISSSATLFYIVKNKDRIPLSIRTKQHMITTLLNAMSSHKKDETMMRNGCLTLCQFRIPNDVLFEFERLVRVLLHSASEMAQDSFVQRIGIYLLNTLACQVGGQQKQRLGDLGVINKMLTIIEERLGRGVCDDVLEVAWSTMWNVTDETPLNCQRFLEAKGMEYFLDCLKIFPSKEELLRNMMGLLGNVAEVKSLRPRLMTYQYITVFSNLLGSSSDGIEVSYNAAGVLAHMASDGPNVWILTPNREEVLNRMTYAIERWELTTERNINYRSFEPILNLVQAYHTPECQHWAVWALANLTTVYAIKYCSLVESEGGLTLLRELLNHRAPPDYVKNLASIVIKNCERFNQQQVELIDSDATLDG